VVIFDCNGVLVDSEQIAAAAAADEFARAGIPITPELVTRYFSGRRPADMLAGIEAATGRKLPVNFSATLAAATLARLRAEVRAMPHEYTRSPGCAGRNAWRHPRPLTVFGQAWKPRGSRNSSTFYFPQAPSATASPRPIYSCTQRPGWGFKPPTASWSRIPRLASLRPRQRVWPHSDLLGAAMRGRSLASS